jgi:hypothetical protein
MYIINVGHNTNPPAPAHNSPFARGFFVAPYPEREQKKGLIILKKHLAMSTVLSEYTTSAENRDYFSGGIPKCKTETEKQSGSRLEPQRATLQRPTAASGTVRTGDCGYG